MGQMIELTASDGHTLAAYRADPAGTPRAGVVVIQEIFGVNAHIREVADDYAAQGYLAIAPALFDRSRPGVELGYDESAIAEGRDLAFAMDPDLPVRDVEAAVKAAARRILNVPTVLPFTSILTQPLNSRHPLLCIASFHGPNCTQAILNNPD